MPCLATGDHNANLLSRHQAQDRHMTRTSRLFFAKAGPRVIGVAGILHGMIWAHLIFRTAISGLQICVLKLNPDPHFRQVIEAVVLQTCVTTGSGARHMRLKMGCVLGYWGNGTTQSLCGSALSYLAAGACLLRSLSFGGNPFSRSSWKCVAQTSTKVQAGVLRQEIAGASAD
jgi:hypothetical protein